MPWFVEVEHDVGLKKQGRAIARSAVRGVILQERRLLLLHSARVGDYQFPGGGIQEQESEHQALARELREELGAAVIWIGQELGRAVEYRRPYEHDFDVFMMTSVYYCCSVASQLGAQGLEQYEQDLGLYPTWVELDTAIACNRALLSAGRSGLPLWVRRDTLVLELLKAELDRG